ncbi:MAG: hypothetical protein HY900_36600 [Deltaproteobacteria bacterium]|nr:hypothetical protein [Deltaproteobacteria bacterium]
MALGPAIVRQLELDDRGAVLERWLAHHLAELISEADSAVGPGKALAENRAVDLILKLWLHRRALPETADPLGGYRDAIAVLGRLMPDANPWRRYRRDGSYEDLLYEMFDTLTRIVLGGVLLTQTGRTRSITEAESTALEDEERLMHAQLETWMQFFDRLPQTPGTDIEIVEPAETEETEVQGGLTEVEAKNVAPEQQTARLGRDVHSAIVENLESLQSDLGELLTRWKRRAHGLCDFDEEASIED